MLWYIRLAELLGLLGWATIELTIIVKELLEENTDADVQA